MKKVLIALFFMVSLLDLFAIYQGNKALVFIAKSLIIPTLLVIYYWSSSQKNTSVTLALAFSFLGDVLLLQEDTKYFIYGILSFLIAQLAYSYRFKSGFKYLNKPIWLIFIAYYLGIMLFMGPRLGSFLIPMGVYGLVLSVMGISATGMYKMTKDISFLIGAVLFIISDSCIAISMFIFPEQNWGILIMSTYIVAQYFLIKAVLRDELEKS